MMRVLEWFVRWCAVGLLAFSILNLIRSSMTSNYAAAGFSVFLTTGAAFWVYDMFWVEIEED